MDAAISDEPLFLGQGLTALDFYLAMLAEWVGERHALLASRPSLRRMSDAVRETAPQAVALDTQGKAAA